MPEGEIQGLKPVLEHFYVLGMKPGMSGMAVLGATVEFDAAISAMKIAASSGYMRVAVCKVFHEIYAGV